MRRLPLILLLCLLLVLAPYRTHAQTAEPPTPTPDQITVNVPSPAGQITIGVPGATVNVPSDTPVTTLAVIIGGAFLLWGGRLLLLSWLDIRRERERARAKLVETENVIKVEEAQTDNEIEVERTKQISKLIDAFSTLTPELHRMGSAVENSTAALLESTGRAVAERQNILSEIREQGKQFNLSVDRQNTLIETLGLAVKRAGDMLEAVDSQHEFLVGVSERAEAGVGRLETLLTNGETGTARFLGGKMNGIEGRIQKLEQDVDTVLRWLQVIGQKVGAELPPSPALPPQEDEDDFAQGDEAP